MKCGLILIVRRVQTLPHNASSSVRGPVEVIAFVFCLFTKKTKTTKPFFGCRVPNHSLSDLQSGSVLFTYFEAVRKSV